MLQRINRFLDHASDFLAARKGLLPLIGIVLVLINAALQFIPGGGWMADSNLLLHLGVVLAILGMLLAWAL
jgi:hypothetical protein